MSVDRDFEQFVLHIKAKTGIDLSLYKEAQMKRRLTTLRQKHSIESFEVYYQKLMESKAMMEEFLDRMTINVSEFRRNPARWDVLEQSFLPQLLGVDRSLRAWSAACSTGEEPYTLAMILSDMGVLGKTELLATDLDAKVLEKAAEGFYLERSLRDLPDNHKKSFFHAVPGGMQVTNDIRKSVRFKQHNLLLDSFESNLDLIICRNVMIYFTEEAKAELYQRFANALRPGGILFVGSTEQIFTPAQYGLETADTFFYRKILA